MELSVREAKALFAEAAAAAARGERVVVTRHGRPFIEMIAAGSVGGIDFDRLETVRRSLGLDQLQIELDPDFDDPQLSRRVLGLEPRGSSSIPTSSSGPFTIPRPCRSASAISSPLPAQGSTFRRCPSGN